MQERDFCAPWDKCLNGQPPAERLSLLSDSLVVALFGIDSPFLVAPQSLPDEYASTVMLLVEIEQRPVFFVEIKPAKHFDSPNGRFQASKQMQERIVALTREYAGSLVPTLHAVSALGTKLCFYTADTATTTVDPAYGYMPTFESTDVPAASRWAFDVTEAEGQAKLIEVVNEVKQMCHAQYSSSF